MTKTQSFGLRSAVFLSEQRQKNAESLLLARIAKKDRSALAEIYDRFQRPLFSYLFHLLGEKELSEDVLQEVMLVVWQKATTFKGSGAASGWIFGIAHHQAFKALRRKERNAYLDLEAAADVPDEAPTPEAGAIRKASAEEVASGLARLTPEHREVLELAFFQDFSCKEIAAIIGIPEGATCSMIVIPRSAPASGLLAAAGQIRATTQAEFVMQWRRRGLWLAFSCVTVNTGLVQYGGFGATIFNPGGLYIYPVFFPLSHPLPSVVKIETSF